MAKYTKGQHKQSTVKDDGMAPGSSDTVDPRPPSDRKRRQDGARRRQQPDIAAVKSAPAPSLAALSTPICQVIGLMIPDLGNPFFSELASGVIKRFHSEQEVPYRVVVVPTDEGNNSMEQEYLGLLKLQKVAGVIAVPQYTTAKDWQSILRLGIKVIFVDRTLDPLPHGVEALVVDNYRGAYDATSYLIRLGHLRIGFMSGPSNAVNFIARLRGFHDAHKDRGIPIDPELEEYGPPMYDFGLEMADKLLQLNPLPTAIFASSNLYGQALVSRIRGHCLKIPTDISVIMFDDAPWASLTTPTITAVQQPAEELGSMAADRLIQHLRNINVSLPANTFVSIPQLRRRGSCHIPHPGSLV